MSLTLRTYMLAALVAFGAILDAWNQNALWPLWLLPAVTILLSIGTEWLIVRFREQPALNDSISFISASPIELGEAALGTLKLNNPAKWPRSLMMQMSWTTGINGAQEIIEVNLNGGESHEENLLFSPRQLGDFTAGEVHTRLRGVFGLAWWQGCIPLSAGFKVVPTRLKKIVTTLSTDANGVQNRPVGTGDSTEIEELRNYVPGDPIKTIDWKASARSPDMKVRTFKPDDRLDIMLVVDSGRSGSLALGDLDRIGHTANMAARFAELTELRGDNVGLLCYSDKPGVMVPLGKGHRHLAMIRSALSDLQASQTESDPRAAVSTLARLVSRRALVVFMTQIDEFDAAGELMTAIRLLIRKHHIVVTNIVDEEIENLAVKGPRNWIDPYRQLASLEYSNAVRHTRLQLERYGVSVVNAPADRIEKELFARYARIRNRRSVG